MESTAVFMIAAVSLGQVSEPKTLNDYVGAGVGHVHVALPAHHVLNPSELARWVDVLGASVAQELFIRTSYEEYVTDHNSLLDRAAPEYLKKSAAAASALQAHGMTSGDFQVAWKDVCEGALRLMNSVEQLEHQFVDSLEPILTPDQAELLPVIRAFATRRKCRSVSTTNRWIKLELRNVWDSLRELPTTAEERRHVAAVLNEYELELTRLLSQWLEAHLDAVQRVQRHLYDSAHGKTPGLQFDPARAWGKCLDTVKRIRLLHLQTAERLFFGLEDHRAESLRIVVKERLFPELYPDSSSAHDVIASLARDTEITERDRSAIIDLLAWYEQEYAKVCDRLEAFCIEWDDHVQSGVGRYRSQDLAPALKPLLEERLTLSHKALRQCEEMVGEALVRRHRPAPPETVEASASE